MTKFIISINGKELRQAPIIKERMTIGRTSDNDIQLDNMAISVKHALMVTVGNNSILHDLDSTNGTFVNNQPITKYLLQDGDVIQLGKFSLKYVIEENSQSHNVPSEEKQHSQGFSESDLSLDAIRTNETEYADNEDKFIITVTKELSLGKKDVYLWQKAIALNDRGNVDDPKIKVIYTRLRADKLKQMALEEEIRRQQPNKSGGGYVLEEKLKFAPADMSADGVKRAKSDPQVPVVAKKKTLNPLLRLGLVIVVISGLFIAYYSLKGMQREAEKTKEIAMNKEAERNLAVNKEAERKLAENKEAERKLEEENKRIAENKRKLEEAEQIPKASGIMGLGVFKIGMTMAEFSEWANQKGAVFAQATNTEDQFRIKGDPPLYILEWLHEKYSWHLVNYLNGYKTFMVNKITLGGISIKDVNLIFKDKVLIALAVNVSAELIEALQIKYGYPEKTTTNKTIECRYKFTGVTNKYVETSTSVIWKNGNIQATYSQSKYYDDECKERFLVGQIVISQNSGGSNAYEQYIYDNNNAKRVFERQIANAEANKLKSKLGDL